MYASGFACTYPPNIQLWFSSHWFRLFLPYVLCSMFMQLLIHRRQLHQLAKLTNCTQIHDDDDDNVDEDCSSDGTGCALGDNDVDSQVFMEREKDTVFCFWYHLRRSTAAAVVDLISHINEINFCQGIYLKPFECLIQLDSMQQLQIAHIIDGIRSGAINNPDTKKIAADSLVQGNNFTVFRLRVNQACLETVLRST